MTVENPYRQSTMAEDNVTNWKMSNKVTDGRKAVSSVSISSSVDRPSNSCVFFSRRFMDRECRKSMQLGAKLQNSLFANRTSDTLRSVPLRPLISGSESLILFQTGQTRCHAKRYEKFESDLKRYDKKIETAPYFTLCVPSLPLHNMYLWQGSRSLACYGT